MTNYLVFDFEFNHDTKHHMIQTGPHLNATSTVGKSPKIILHLLTWYPLMWTIGILLYALVKSQPLIMAVMFSCALFFYLGLITWIGLLIYMSVKKRMTSKEVLLHIIILSLGIIAAYGVFEYDILGSGVKYMD